MKITAEMVKHLRESTGAGVLDCKKALMETGGDAEKAAALLREKGLAEAAKKMGRVAKEGIIAVYSHAGDKLASMVEVNCETDFVARTDEFRQLARDLAMQVAAMKPRYVSIDEVPPEVIEEEKRIYRTQVEGNKPAHVIDRIIEGKLAKFYADVCLLEQPFIRDDKVKVAELIRQKIALLGENIVVRRFARFEIGE